MRRLTQELSHAQSEHTRTRCHRWCDLLRRTHLDQRQTAEPVFLLRAQAGHLRARTQARVCAQAHLRAQAKLWQPCSRTSADTRTHSRRSVISEGHFG